jgi:ribonuclease-3
MANIINAKRMNQITTFLKSLNIKSKRFSEIISTQNISIIKDFNQALIHSSEDKILNYEKLEFFGDAVLRLAATNFIEKNIRK